MSPTEYLREMKENGISCNDCFWSMQNCKDMSICCEMEDGLCTWFKSVKDYDETAGTFYDGLWDADGDDKEKIRK